ncbi:hypothetical protein ACA910_002983 [Epithemia clementina (nom. ined.)]
MNTLLNKVKVLAGLVGVPNETVEAPTVWQAVMDACNLTWLANDKAESNFGLIGTLSKVQEAKQQLQDEIWMLKLHVGSSHATLDHVQKELVSCRMVAI